MIEDVVDSTKVVVASTTGISLSLWSAIPEVLRVSILVMNFLYVAKKVYDVYKGE
tara:strand:+ start:173 stop:337 length:165 start_codon:yes stop_codon:yes gene_type:complete